MKLTISIKLNSDIWQYSIDNRFKKIDFYLSVSIKAVGDCGEIMSEPVLLRIPSSNQKFDFVILNYEGF